MRCRPTEFIQRSGLDAKLDIPFTYLPRSAIMRFILAWCLLCAVTPVHAQWRLAAEYGVEWFGGTSRALVGENIAFQPDRPGTAGLGVFRTMGSAEVGVILRAASPRLALGDGSETLVTDVTQMEVAGLHPRVRVPATRAGKDTRLYFVAGPILEIWEVGDPENPEDKTLLGGAVGIELDAALTRRLSLRVTGDLGVTPESPFADILPEEYEARAAWRRSIRLGVTYRLGR